MIRLFVALNIPGDALSKVLEECYRAVENPHRFKWETKEKIHLTLKFIGEVDENLIGKISEELEFVKEYSTFNCSVSRFGFFFRNREPKILWSDVQTDKPLKPIVMELDRRMQKYGIETDKREFNAHLTLLRIKQDVSEKFIQRIKTHLFEKINFTASSISLVQSRLSKEGATYTNLKTFELK
jgi:2'-5' RNA ligase